MLVNNKKFNVFQEDSQLKIKIANSKKPFYLKKDSYYSELAQFIEILKVEGYWNCKGNIAIQNKSTELTKYFESLIKGFGINYSKSILIKIKTPKLWNNKKQIFVFEGNTKRAFHFGRNGFTQKFDSIVFETKNTDKKFNIQYKNEYFLFYLQDGQIDTPKIKSYFVLKASNKSFTQFMKLILNEENSTHKLRINNYLKASTPKIIAKVFGSVIDCDGSIIYYGLKREINLQQSSLNYIKDWNKLLNSININSNISKKGKLYKLTITCNQNFKKLNQFGFELHHKIKKTRFQHILNNYKKHQLERNTALNYYKQLVKNNPQTTALNISIISNKNKRVVSHYLKKLFKLGEINRIKITKQKYIYY